MAAPYRLDARCRLALVQLSATTITTFRRHKNRRLHDAAWAAVRYGCLTGRAAHVRSSGQSHRPLRRGAAARDTYLKVARSSCPRLSSVRQGELAGHRGPGRHPHSTSRGVGGHQADRRRRRFQIHDRLARDVACRHPGQAAAGDVITSWVVRSVIRPPGPVVCGSRRLRPLGEVSAHRRRGPGCAWLEHPPPWAP